MDRRPGGQLRQGLAGLGSSVLLPGLARLREMPSKGMLVPGAILVLSVMGLFWSISRPMVGVPIAAARAGGRSFLLYMPLAFWIVALLCALGAVYFVYRLCGKERPWWALLVPALIMGLLMQEWFAHLWLTLFHEFLVGGLPPPRTWDSVPMFTLFAKVFFGVGLNEELWKAIPIGICVWIARNVQGPLGAKIGISAFEAVAYGFDASGLGLSTVGALYLSPFGKTDGKGYFVQGTYTVGKTKFGINFGENRDSGGALADTNKFRSATVGVYHSLNKYITLVGEYNQERGEGADLFPGDLKTRTISLGGILFF